MLADFAARMINPPFETPFGLVIALIGVPVLLIRGRREQRWKEYIGRCISCFFLLIVLSVGSLMIGTPFIYLDQLLTRS